MKTKVRRPSWRSENGQGSEETTQVEVVEVKIMKSESIKKLFDEMKIVR